MNEFQKYIGRFPEINNKRQYACYMAGVTISGDVYPEGTCDWDLKADQILLNEETADYIYSDFTPLTIDFKKSSRPVLEGVIEKICKPEMSEREKVFAILQYSYQDFKEEFGVPEGVHCILNAREEEILTTGGGQCEDRSRLIICLAQIAGLPARSVASYGHLNDKNEICGGHAILEIYLEGKWSFFDSLRTFYCLNPDNSIASLWELACNPALAETQTEEVMKSFKVEKKEMNKEEYIKYYDKYLDKKNIMAINNYSVNAFSKYEWNKLDLTEGQDKLAGEKKTKIIEEILAAG
ncbi:MAG: transglutaminase-like domain-containing protein [Planctomycetota bacterium]